MWRFNLILLPDESGVDSSEKHSRSLCLNRRSDAMGVTFVFGSLPNLVCLYPTLDDILRIRHEPREHSGKSTTAEYPNGIVFL